MGRETQSPIKHGHARIGNYSSEYYTWSAMKKRCNNKKDRQYKDYGGRGISVCERWNDFSNFIVDMGRRPKGADIDRIDNNGNYCPENCRWTTRRENCRNKRNNVFITFNGLTQTMMAWSELTGMAYDMLRYRHDLGWSDEKILLTPNRYTARRKTEWLNMFLQKSPDMDGFAGS